MKVLEEYFNTVNTQERAAIVILTTFLVTVVIKSWPTSSKITFIDLIVYHTSNRNSNRLKRRYELHKLNPHLQITLRPPGLWLTKVREICMWKWRSLSYMVRRTFLFWFFPHLLSDPNCVVEIFLGLCTKERVHRLHWKWAETLKKTKISSA